MHDLRVLAAIGTVVAGLSLPAALPAQTGSVSGSVVFHGSPPEPRLLEVTADNAYCGRNIPANDLIIQNGKVAHAVVWVEGAEGAVEPREYRLSNTACHFEPPVLAATVGSVLTIENTDPILHNTHLVLGFQRGKRTVANVALPKAGLKIQNRRALRRPGLIDVSCDAHTWMNAKIWVFDHPYFAVTGADGLFQIRDLPPGTYTLKVWHQVLGEQQREITVAEGQSTEIEFAYTGS